MGILLATYNGELYCEDQILSLLWQRGVDAHVYVRDDGSKDGTFAILQQLAARFSGRLTLVPHGERFTGSASGNFFELLRSVDITRHDYVAFADQDDVWLPDKLIRAVAGMNAHRADGYSADLIAFQKDGGESWIVHKAGRDAELDYLFQGASAGCTYLLSRHAAEITASVARRMPTLCAGASHDWIIYAICRSRGLKWFRDPAATILYRQHATNQYGTRRGWADIAAKARLTRSGWYRDNILWLRHVVVGHDNELRVLNAIEKGGVAQRWWLVRQARRFRRSREAVMQLRGAIAMGLV
ncbi:glycosyltransferase [Sphingomonas sp. BK580]|uniref:glycosyltransferase n=1 Tax=Sphingomonas sp. BK580 TaxID=2586972 RepID=UPI0016165A9A|nr:glycosyltransferase [Sphingomonas sp. BK580]MBB3693787.1 rhamnosyltransferase [Sphingomonas sp. BK580]